MKTALIFGMSGQDGHYLSRHLMEKGYNVHGSRKIDITIQEDIEWAIKNTRPDEIYNLAAISSVAEAFKRPVETAEVNGLAVVKMLEAIRTIKPDAKFFQASSSEMYGGPDASRFIPKSPYATAKLFAHHTVRNYRDAYGLYACSGIMFNHESPIRPPHYVTRKITQGMAMISQGKKDRLVLGNLDARRDFGYAAEYVEAMHLMLQQPEPKDYVIATGETHSIRDFVEVAGRCVGYEIEWRGCGVEEKGYDKKTGRLLVEVSADLFRPSDVPTVHGYPRKIYIELGWRAKVRFDELVALMVESDLERVD